jgi:hypothetical protein
MRCPRNFGRRLPTTQVSSVEKERTQDMADKKHEGLKGEDSSDPHQRLDYLERVDDALTRDVWKKVGTFARKRVRTLALAGYGIDSDLVDELVSDAVADTALGVCRWDPERCDLLTHLCWVIRGRTHKRTLRRRAITETDVFDRIDDQGATLAQEVESPETLVGRTEVVLEFLRALRDLAIQNEDDEVVALLDAYWRGLTQRTEVAKELGITKNAYTYARDRLSRLIDQLPARLRDEALAVMRGQ